MNTLNQSTPSSDNLYNPSFLLSGFDSLSTSAVNLSNEAIDQPLPPTKPDRPKLNEDRLLQPDALPYLRSAAKNIKFKKEKGSELENLDKLMNFYKVWAHRVYPHYPFKRFVERTMRLAHSKRMNSHLSQWIREDLQPELTYDANNLNLDDINAFLNSSSTHLHTDPVPPVDDVCSPQYNNTDLSHHVHSIESTVNTSLPLPHSGNGDSPSHFSHASNPYTSTTMSAKQRAIARLDVLRNSRFASKSIISNVAESDNILSDGFSNANHHNSPQVSGIHVFADIALDSCPVEPSLPSPIEQNSIAADIITNGSDPAADTDYDNGDIESLHMDIPTLEPLWDI